MAMHSDGQRAKEQAEQGALAHYDEGYYEEGHGVYCFEFAPIGGIGVHAVIYHYYPICKILYSPYLTW